jgi:hypothetical protein
MRNTLYLILCAAMVSLFFLGCDKSQDDFREEIVVQGQMIVGHPLSIRLTRTIPIEQYYDPARVGVSGASVHIWANDNERILREDTLHPGTYVDSLIVASGVVYRLHAEAEGRILTAQSDPGAPLLRIDSCNHSVFRNPDRMDSIVFGTTPFFIRWNDDPARGGTVHLIKNLETDWWAEDRKTGGNNGSPAMQQFIWTQRHGNEIEVPWIALGSTGRYQILTLSCDEAVYDYFQTIQPGSAEMYPNTNVQGGLGVFGAASVDTSYFCLLNRDGGIRS